MDSNEDSTFLCVSMSFFKNRIYHFLRMKMTSFLRSHMQAFTWELDPIQDYAQSTSKSNKNRLSNLHYLIAFSAVVILHLDSFLLWLSNDSQSMFHHKVFLKAFWKCSDVAYLSTVTLTLLVLGRLTFSWQPKEKYRLRINRKGTRIVNNNSGIF